MKLTQYTRPCAVCGTRFDIKIKRNGRPSTRKTCSKECSVARRVAPNPWKQEEVDWLLENIQSRPLSQFLRAFNAWAAMNGYKTRTKNSLDKKIRALGYSTRPIIEYYTPMRLSQMLNIPRDTIHGWKKLKEHPLETYQHDHKYKAFNYITGKQFKDFARHHPECLGGADEIGLQILLEDSLWAKEILRAYPKRPAKMFPSMRVRCIDTGKIYPSLGAAARDIHVVRQSVARAVHNGSKVCGLRFEAV